MLSKAHGVYAAIVVCTLSEFALAGGMEAFLVKPTATKAATTAPVYDPPLVDWAAPQSLSSTPGMSVSPSLDRTDTGKIQAKATGIQYTVASFIPVTPCRLVDTRGVFNPVYGGPP